MAITTKKITVPATEAYEKEVEDRLICDICGQATDVDFGWEKGRFDINEVVVAFSEGVRCPDGDDKTTYHFDVCPACFQDVIMPFFKQYKAEPRIEKIDW